MSALVTLSAIALLGFAVRRALGFAPPVAARLAGVLVALAAWATEPATVTAGYSDALWAAAFVAGALPLLLGQPARPVDVGLLAVAALSKNEAFLAVVTLAMLLTVFRRAATGWWLPWLPVAAGGSWAALSRALGATSDLQAGGRFRELITVNPVVWDRLAPTVRALWAVVGNVVTVAAVVALLGTLALRGRRRRLGLASDGWLWGMVAGYTVLLILAYLISPYDINWHLRTSLDRVSLPLVLLACASCAIWAGVALDHMPGTSGAGAKADADTAHPVDSAGRTLSGHDPRMAPAQAPALRTGRAPRKWPRSPAPGMTGSRTRSITTNRCRACTCPSVHGGAGRLKRCSGERPSSRPVSGSRTTSVRPWVTR
ncbi:MAG: hypothetical protein IRY92_09900 [Dactylosporangium sp.]|nr:hypothetical protein [Dactylosporangium sp.]